MESKKEYRKRYYEEHKKEYIEYRKKYYYKNVEKAREKSKKYYENNKEKHTERVNIWVNKNKEKSKNIHRAAHLRRAYGISLQYYDKLFMQQKGRCFICGQHENELKKKLCVDHNHQTGNVRGLLCRECNIGLSKFKDDIFILRKAILYLKKINI